MQALGDREDLSVNNDGSLDLYIQSDAPEADREANWLPVAKAPFILLMRLYSPLNSSLAHGRRRWRSASTSEWGNQKAICGGDGRARGRMGLRLVHDLANVHKKRVAERSASLVVRAETPPVVGHAWITRP